MTRDAFRREIANLDVAARDRRAIGDRLDRPQRARRRQLRGQLAALDRSRPAQRRRRRAPEHRHRERQHDGRDGRHGGAPGLPVERADGWAMRHCARLDAIGRHRASSLRHVGRGSRMPSSGAQPQAARRPSRPAPGCGGFPPAAGRFPRSRRRGCSTGRSRSAAARLRPRGGSISTLVSAASTSRIRRSRSRTARFTSSAIWRSSVSIFAPPAIAIDERGLVVDLLRGAIDRHGDGEEGRELVAVEPEAVAEACPRSRAASARS